MPVMTALVMWAATVCAAPQTFFVLDNGLRGRGLETIGAQLDLAKSVGFDGVAWRSDTPQRLAEVRDGAKQRGLKVVAVYVNLDLREGKLVPDPHVQDVIAAFAGTDTLLWPNITSKLFPPSDPAGDEIVVAGLRDLAARCEARGLRIALYPHVNMWAHRLEDALRVVKKVNRKNVGLTFNLCHALMDGAGDRIPTLLSEAAPHLLCVTINGADGGVGKKDWTRLIRPLDEGTFDVGRVIRSLREIGYAGPVGLQCYNLRKEPGVHLPGSMAVWRRWLLAPVWAPAKGWQEVGGVSLDPQDARAFKADPGTGVFYSPGKAAYLCTREAYGDVEVHIEFNVPKGSNSGVYFGGSHEVQILDSHGAGEPSYPGNVCGGIYPEWLGNTNVRGHNPRVNVSKPAGEWQTFDVMYRAARFDAGGRKIANARFEKVVHNGQVVQENVELLGPTREGLPEKVAGPLRIQGDHGPVAIRDVRIRPLMAE